MTTRLRFTVTVGTIVGIETLMILTGMEPDLVLVTGFAAAIAAGAWALVDLHGAAATLRFPTAGGHTLSPAAREPITSALLFMLHGRRRDDTAAQLHATLVDVVDQQLLASHGIDRRTDPEAAAAVLPPELRSLVDGPTTAVDWSQIGQLEQLVAHIESI